jgi:hypothetical protein
MAIRFNQPIHEFYDPGGYPKSRETLWASTSTGCSFAHAGKQQVCTAAVMSPNDQYIREKSRM